LKDLLFGEPLPDLEGEVWCGGQAHGPLLVANLTVATHLLGTPHLPSLKGAILVLEDVGEAPYRIERMLTHWRLCGALQQLAGIAWGSFEGCEDPTGPERASFSLEEVLRERTADLGIPVVAGLPVGHGPGNAALPLGVPAHRDGAGGRLSLLAPKARAASTASEMVKSKGVVSLILEGGASSTCTARPRRSNRAASSVTLQPWARAMAWASRNCWTGNPWGVWAAHN